jgi:hypothetical protein
VSKDITGFCTKRKKGEDQFQIRQNIADFLYSNFLGRTSKKKHPVEYFGQSQNSDVPGVPVEVFLHMPALHETGKMLPESISLRSSQGTCCMHGLDQDLD